jgi:hypothetical protein
MSISIGRIVALLLAVGYVAAAGFSGEGWQFVVMVLLGVLIPLALIWFPEEIDSSFRLAGDPKLSPNASPGGCRLVRIPASLTPTARRGRIRTSSNRGWRGARRQSGEMPVGTTTTQCPSCEGTLPRPCRASHPNIRPDTASWFQITPAVHTHGFACRAWGDLGHNVPGDEPKKLRRRAPQPEPDNE